MIKKIIIIDKNLDIIIMPFLFLMESTNEPVINENANGKTRNDDAIPVKNIDFVINNISQRSVTSKRPPAIGDISGNNSMVFILLELFSIIEQCSNIYIIIHKVELQYKNKYYYLEIKSIKMIQEATVK